MRCRAGAELGRFSGFTMKETVVGGEAVVFDDGARGDQLLAGGSGLQILRMFS
jgi:hypothetical protein